MKYKAQNMHCYFNWEGKAQGGALFAIVKYYICVTYPTSIFLKEVEILQT